MFVWYCVQFTIENVEKGTEKERGNRAYRKYEMETHRGKKINAMENKGNTEYINIMEWNE